MPMALLASDGVELRRYLLSEGVAIATNPNVRARLADYITSERPEVTARCVTRTGWHGNAFVLPRETFGDSAAEQVLFQAANPDGIALSQGGTLEGWREHIAVACAGHSRLVLALCTGFAGPCLGLLGMDGGGFHLRGASSTGKSTALSVAASALGPPEYSRTWRHTDNALEGVAALHSDLLLILDEIGQLDPKHAGDVAYLLANGQGKGRAARDGSPRALATWRILFLSAGEISLTDLVVQSGGKARAGQEVRVIDLPADAGAGNGIFEALPEGMAPGVLADALKAASATHYGHALQALLRVLTSDPTKARKTLLELRSTIATMLANGNQTGQVRRVAERFALVAAAGELATTHGLTGWSDGEATRAAQTCFAAWLDARGTNGAAEPAAMLEQVRGFLSANGEARFTAWDEDFDTEDSRSRTINRVGYRKKGEDGPVYYVEREAFKNEVCKGFDYRAVVKVLAAAGALMLDGDGGRTRKERLPDGRRTRVYVITPALWGNE
jgi:putative DNA primase/helicase